MSERPMKIVFDRLLGAERGRSTDSMFPKPTYRDSVIETAVSQLRKKVDDGRPKLIHTVRGFGYTLRPPSP